ncbi:virion core protein, T7 gp14 family [Labrys neptuniae]
MCDPITLGIASFAIGAASSVANYMGQQSAADAQNQMYEANRKNAVAAYEEKALGLGQRQAQEMDAAAADKFDTALEARAARATTSVAADQNGVAGATVDGLLRDMYAQEGRYGGRVDTNTDWSMAQIQQDKKSASYQTVSQVNSVPRGQKPSFMNLGLQIAGAGLNATSTYLDLKNKSKTS